MPGMIYNNNRMPGILIQVQYSIEMGTVQYRNATGMLQYCGALSSSSFW